jgi:hypothetical protein
MFQYFQSHTHSTFLAIDLLLGQQSGLRIQVIIRSTNQEQGYKQKLEYCGVGDLYLITLKIH